MAVPAYVVGVDVYTNAVYIRAVLHGTTSGFTTMTTRFKLNCKRLKELWQEIEARLSTLDSLALSDPLVIKVLMKRGAVEVRRGRLTEASTVLQDVLRRYPQGAHLAEAYYLLGTVYQRQNQPANSLQAYETGLAQPPTFPWTAKTLWTLARLQEERQELARAVEL